MIGQVLKMHYMVIVIVCAYKNNSEEAVVENKNVNITNNIIGKILSLPHKG